MRGGVYALYRAYRYPHCSGHKWSKDAFLAFQAAKFMVDSTLLPLQMKIISLFSGAGGLDLGLIQAGHQVIWANDIDADAVNTYRNNIGAHIVQEDIRNIDLSQLPTADVVVGGFPCQGFSQANLLRKVEDTRNQLYKFFYETIRIKQPKFFIAENVRGILSLGKGSAIKKIEDDFRAAGYITTIHIAYMPNYGIPQTRTRVFILGQRKDIGDDFLLQFPKETHNKRGDNGMLPWVSIKDALCHFPDPDKPNSIPNHVYSAYKLAFRNFTGHRPTDPDKPSPTILARGNGKGGVCAIPHYNGKRRLTIRESASIQTFPENFVFSGAMNSCYRQIGNAVPVAFARLLGIELANLHKRK